MKEKEGPGDGENGEEDELQEKLVRRGRSSGGGEELLRGSENSRGSKKVSKKKGKVAQETTGDPSAPKKRGRPFAAQVEEQAEEPVVEKAAAKRKGRRSVGRVDEPVEVEEAAKQSNSPRRKRSSNPTAEMRTITKNVPDDVPKRRGRHPAAEQEIGAEVEEFDEDPIAPQKRRRPVQRAEADHTQDELDDSNPKKEKKNKSRSGVDVLEAESLALTTTEDYTKGKSRTKPSSGVASRDDEKRGRKRTRRSEAYIQDVRPTASSIADQQEGGQIRTRHQDAQLQEAATAGSSKQAKHSRHRDQRVEVEATSSNLQRNHSGPEKGVKTSHEKRTKSITSSGLVEQSRNSKRRTRFSIEGTVAEAVAEPSQAHNKGSKKQAQEETQSRKRKNVESECLVPFLFIFILILVEHPESELVKRRRFEKLPSQDQDTPEGDEVPLYQHLQAVTRKVSRHIIDAKWEPLPSGCVERISQFLQDLQRPVVIRYNDERKKTQSSTALQMISRRLVSKVSKGLPFPQGTRNHREDDFDFEKILDHNRALEAQLTPALHANELLEAQVSKELACLEFEQETLVRLEANAKTEAGLRSEAARRLHSLLQPQDGIMDIEELKDDVGLTNAQVPLLLDHSVSILVPWCQL